MKAHSQVDVSVLGDFVTEKDLELSKLELQDAENPTIELDDGPKPSEKPVSEKSEKLVRSGSQNSGEDKFVSDIGEHFPIPTK